MARDLALLFAETIKREWPHLCELTEQRASVARAPGKWSPKEELGHLIDSATNNHIRFVRGAIESEYRGPGYSQDEWVRLHGYNTMLWEKIRNLWYQYNLLLTELVERIPEDRLTIRCSISTNPPVTLGFVIEDYVLHMQHHIDQLLRREVITAYPGAKIRAAI